MNPVAAPVRHAMAVITALVLAAGVTTAVTGRGVDKDRVRTTGAPTSTPGGAGATSTTGVGEATTTTGVSSGGGAGGTSPTTLGSGGGAAGGGGSGAAGKPGPLRPPALGTYRYDRTSTDPEDDDRVVVVTVAKRPGAGSDVTLDVSDDHEETKSTVAWRSDGVFMLETKIDSEEVSSSCDWNPDVRMYPAALSAGTTWESDSSCTVTTSLGSFKLRIVTRSKVLRAERATVGGTAVDVWVIDEATEATFEEPRSGHKGTQRATGVSFFAPGHGIDVKSKLHVDAVEGGAREAYDEERTLQSLKPG